MARSLRLFLIRHGETVDNVAQLYAGSRDSALTNHGYQQATRLGLHYKALCLTFTHLFSSHLQRAAKTAGLIREAQIPQKNDTESVENVPEVIQLRVLMEQDFGDLEGKKWTDIQAELQNKLGFAAVETKDALRRRADTFLDEHLLPLLGNTTGGKDLTIAIVSHGIFLSTLWKRLLPRLPTKSITLSPDLSSTVRPSLEHLGGWSNTGYLELHMMRDEIEKSSPDGAAAPSITSKLGVSRPEEPNSDGTVSTTKVPRLAALGTTSKGEASQAAHGVAASNVDPIPAAAETQLATPTTPLSSKLGIAEGWTTTIMTVNGKDHLKGLKRTGGGVGSSRHYVSQKGIESFFKRRKVD